RHPVLRQERYMSGEQDPVTGLHDIEWHGVRFRQQDFSHYTNAIAFSLAGMGQDNTFYVIINAYWEGIDFELPPLPKGWLWVQVVNTGLESPDDICALGHERPVHPKQTSYHAGPRSVIILMSNQ
ncbi:MAG: glycogen debranching enzyme, partial [Anaerolineales bacterium]